MKKNPTPRKNNLGSNKWNIILGALLLGFISLVFYYNNQPSIKAINEQQLIAMLQEGQVKRVVLMKQDDYVKIQLTQSAFYHKKYKQGNKELAKLSEQDTHYILKIAHNFIFDQHWSSIQTSLPPAKRISYEVNDSISLLKAVSQSYGSILFLLFLLWMFGLGMLGKRNNIFNIGRSKALSFDKENKVNITFKHVKGVDEAKEEIKEIVDFLKNPSKYTKLGGRMPKGVLLVGPPGCGKTLLAKAVAGEAACPFFSISGSDFVEMFVGVGASRVRDLFEQAKKVAPCIVFIDEIDAVGRKRGSGNWGGNDEREQTVNALLTEMDGFSSTTNIIIMAATNRPEVLDPALKRPGRFDREISVDKPELKGRKEIFELYLKNLKVATNVAAERLAQQTVGFTGADIDNVCNKAALIGAKKNRKQIQIIDFHEAIDQVIGGLEKKDKLMHAEEKKIVAYHEAGHGVVSWFLKHADPLIKISITPRGSAALGYAQYLPKEKFIYQEAEMLDRVCKLMGGRAAEMIFFNALSTGAQNDLEGVTQLAYNMVSVYGMGGVKVGQVSFPQDKDEYNFGNPFSETTGQAIDAAVRNITQTQYERALEIIKEHKILTEKIAQKLLEKEVLYRKDVEAMIGSQPLSEE